MVSRRNLFRSLDSIVLVLYFILVSINNVVTNFYVLEFVLFTRKFVFIGLLFVLFFRTMLSIKSNSFFVLLSLVLIFFFFGNGFIFSCLYGGASLMKYWELLLTITITFLGVLVFNFTSRLLETLFFPRLVLAFGIFILTIHILSDSLIFVPFPLFSLDAVYYKNTVLNMGNDSQSTYSQGLSFFYSLTCLAAVYLLKHDSFSRIMKVNLIMLTGLFFILAISGGGRGEILALIFILFISFRKYLSFYFLTLFIVWSLFTYLNSYISNFYVFQRFLGFSEGDLGMRDTFIYDSFNILLDTPLIFLFGGGFNVFQSKMNYEIGYYPHNLLIEFILVYGILVTIFFIYIFLQGISRKYKGRMGFSIWWFSFLLIVSFKSGSLLTSYVLISFLLYIIALSVKDYRSIISIDKHMDL
jgi:hypothetical protein